MAAKRIAFVLGMGAGYVLGAKAGRQRYQQIVTKAQDVWQNPRVQAKADEAQHLAKEKAGAAGSAVAGTVTKKASAVGSTIADKVHKSDSGASSGSSHSGSGATSGSNSSGAASGSSGAHSRSDVPTAEEVSLGGTNGGVDAPSPAPSTPPSPVPGSGSSQTPGGSGSTSGSGSGPVPGSGGADSGVNSPSDKLPPHPVAKPGVPGGSPE